LKEIILTQGKVALVDDWNYEWLNQFKWCAHRDQKNGRWYAVRGSNAYAMHREVMGNPEGMDVDHIDRSPEGGLDNCEENLRVATKSQNMHNQGLAKHNTSGFKGVSWYKAASKWVACIYVNNKRRYLGYFDTAIEAARAYNAASLKYHGERGFINPLPQEQPAALAA
jgi:hypothetical protein